LDFGTRDRHAHPLQFKHARERRRNATPAGRILWSELKDKQMKGHKFRRQSPLGNYIADFVCLPARLIIEVDGIQHAEAKQARHDRVRTIWLRGQNYRVLRFWNDEVRGDLAMVLTTIAHALANTGYEHAERTPLPSRTPPPDPRAQGAGEKF
jgi:very-short-patch-repair endonuclease